MEEGKTTEQEIKLEDDVINAILDGFNRPDLNLVDYNVTPGSLAGDNYSSILYSLKINLKDPKSSDSLSLPLMLKVLPKNEFRLKLIRDGNIFVRDINMYNMILPSMEKFQRDAGLNESEIIKPWPKCYAGKTDGENDFLAMEDLKADGFKMPNRKEGLDWEHCSLFIKTLAKFHAISFAMFGGDFDKIVEKYPWLVEAMWNGDKLAEPLKQYFQGSFMQHAGTLKEMGDEQGSAAVGKIYNENFFPHMFSLVGGKVPMAIIGHGDCWLNNLMFKYDPETNKPVDIKLVDFQQSRASSRLADIHYFLYTSPQMSLLNEREGDLLQLYFDEFTKFAKKLGVDLDGPHRELLSRASFDKEVEKFRYFGIITGILMASLTTVDAADIPDMENMTEEDLTGGTGDGGKDAKASFFATMGKEKAMVKIKNIVSNHLPKCAEAKQNL